ncbi:MAG: DNA gyrase subunit A [Deltaproteobacteria bacterium]|nr:DNA gyrase subunit A [Deltaproteobacteria bacterium]MDQ3300128.1 DNA gyrase subunit A [Myxococcota bacterium]
MSDATASNITMISIEQEMKSSFMDYAMSVIVSRALPDARDGLKPVHRRILFAQKGLNNVWNRPYLKCARIVGDVIGKYHPHGDQSVYDALVRMAQDFSMRYMLVDGQGNFGSVDNDPAAAMRYTECRMSRLAGEMLADIDKETVDWQPNYDDKETEPTVMPTRIPNLLVNGASGIAVGMATNIPPHNLGEIVDAVLALIAQPSLTDDDLIKYVPGPDFPTGGVIQGRVGILSAYKTGRGAIQVRGVAHVDEIRKDRFAIIVTELPFQVVKSRWIEATADMVRDKKLEGISDIRDESDRTGMRVVFELKKDANDQVVLANLFKYTSLQTSFSVNMLAIVEGRPETLTLKRALQVFIEHRREVVTRRTLFDLREARSRREIVEGLGLAVINIDRVIEIIRGSKDTDIAKERLIAEKMSGLGGFLERAGRPPDEVAAAEAKGFVFLTPRQAQAILDMRLGRLTGLEREKLEAEYKELWELTDYLEGLLSDEKKMVAAIAEEMRAVKEQFADERRTKIVDAEGEILTEELIDEENVVVTRTHLGYIKRTRVREYEAQGRGGRGITGAASTEGDFITDMFAASTHDHVLLFTDRGRAYYKKVFELPEGSRTAKGRPVVNVLDLQEGEQVVAMLPFNEWSEETHVFFATQSGTVKKTALSQFENVRQNGIKAISIDDGDRLVGASLVTKADDVLVTSAKGFAVRFTEDRVRPMGRTAGGVRGINLREGDRLVGMVTFPREAAGTLITVCQRGYGKRTALADYPTKNRGGKGVIAIKTTTRNGQVSATRIVTDEDDLILISDRGKLIRLRVKDISIQGRATQGVRLMRVDDGEHVAAIERLAEPGEESGIEAASPIEAADDGDTVPNEGIEEELESDDEDDADEVETDDEPAE